ncbi:glutamine synthetase beta-grasp domain-containing protein [Streptomyces sp. NPDC048717]|uniref:glutamine synthetase beta-grasp domain-containing protein n=1 Tax=Streptomyces sp. NPDC048717 TaxID=3154928 RepID=UPI00341300F8
MFAMNAATPAPADLVDTDFVQLLFTDVAGRLRNVEIPTARWAATLASGRPLDSAAILGETGPDEEELRLVPDPGSFVLRPWRTPAGRGIGMVFCEVLDRRGRPFAGDPRAVLRRAGRLSAARGQRARFGVTAEFGLLPAESLPPGTVPRAGAGHPAAGETGEDERTAEICRDISEALGLMGRTVTGHHQDLRTGRWKITFEEGDALDTADRLLLFRHTAATMARRRNMTAVFSPGPQALPWSDGPRVQVSLIGTGVGTGVGTGAGTGMDSRPSFHDPEESLGVPGPPSRALAGLLAHAPGLSALDTLSAPGFPGFPDAEAGVAGEAAEACPCPACAGDGTPGPRAGIRACGSATFKAAGDPGAPESTRLEIRVPGPAGNPYLLFTGILAALADEGQDRAPAGASSPAAADGRAPAPTPACVASVPTGLPAAIRALENDDVLCAALGEPLTRAVVRAGRERGGEPS